VKRCARLQNSAVTLTWMAGYDTAENPMRIMRDAPFGTVVYNENVDVNRGRDIENIIDRFSGGKRTPLGKEI